MMLINYIPLFFLNIQSQSQYLKKKDPLLHDIIQQLYSEYYTFYQSINKNYKNFAKINVRQKYIHYKKFSHRKNHSSSLI